MDYTFKNWNANHYYDFSVEFNRIESYNKYCNEWVELYGLKNNDGYTFIHKTDWTYSDIVDLNAYNRVKRNINKLREYLQLPSDLTIEEQAIQTFNHTKANELETKLKSYLALLGAMQFRSEITGNAVAGGNGLRIVG